jgi:probable F420-dependent oxidoreductase
MDLGRRYLLGTVAMRVEGFVMDHDWGAAAESARRIEAAGFDSLAVPEINADPFLLLAAAASATTRVGLRTAIAVAFPRSPMVVAQIAWDLQRNSRGRFGLGLGTQVKGHNERRFSVPWTPDAAVRLGEYVESLRAIWHTWRTGAPLAFEGTHYRFTLMTPEFVPPPLEIPDPPVYVAAVRPAMLRLAGRVCDGVRLHGFCTRRYLEEVALPSLETGLRQAGRHREEFEVCGGGFVVTGPDDATVARMSEAIRYRIAFYGSTRSYHPVLAVHGWEDLGMELHQLSKRGRWSEMAALVTDDVLREFCAVATYDRLPAAIAERFGGLSDGIELGLPEMSVSESRELLSDIQRLPARFAGRHRAWS